MNEEDLVISHFMFGFTNKEMSDHLHYY